MFNIGNIRALTSAITKLPAFSKNQPNPDKQQARLNAAIIETLEVKGGRRGDPLDANPTYRDLVATGVLGIVDGNNQYVVKDGVRRLSDGRGVSIPGTQSGAIDYTIPPAPTGLTASGTLTSIHLTFDSVSYTNHAYTEIWREQVTLVGQTPDPSVIGNAVKIGTTQGYSKLYIDAVGSGADNYYWIRFVSRAGVEGPFNAVNGVRGTTSVDPAFLLSVLSGSITSTELATSLSSRIDLIDAPGTGLVDSLLAEAAARSTADSAHDTSISSLTVATNDNAAAIITEQSVRSSADTALASNITALGVTVSSNTTAGTNNAAAIVNEQNVRASADTALASDITSLGVTVGSNTAAISSETTARANADTALSSSLTTLTTTVSGNTASIQTHTSSINGLSAEYLVKLDVNGRVSGFGTYAGTNTTDFLIAADLFGVTAPVTDTETAPASPFLNQLWKQTSTGTIKRWDGAAWVATTPTDRTPLMAVATGRTIDGVYFDQGVYINGRLVTDGSIVGASIAAGTLTADKMTVGTITAASGIIADLAVDTLQIKDNAVTVPVFIDQSVPYWVFANETPYTSSPNDNLRHNLYTVQLAPTVIVYGDNYPAPVIIGSMTLDVIAGIPVVIDISMTGYADIQSFNKGSYDISIKVEILRNGVSYVTSISPSSVLAFQTAKISGASANERETNYNPQSFKFVDDSPIVGVVTYEIQAHMKLSIEYHASAAAALASPGYVKGDFRIGQLIARAQQVKK